jgi:hypothetical protein
MRRRIALSDQTSRLEPVIVGFGAARLNYLAAPHSAEISRTTGIHPRGRSPFRSSAAPDDRKAIGQSKVADNPVQVRERIGDTELPLDNDPQLLAVPDISPEPV